MNVLHNSCASVRVYVPTYRRHVLLQRALESLRAQTFADWVCEVHNDDPKDRVPAKLVKRLGDSRIQLCNHERNLGACATFNLFYRPTPETFYCLLEDDNWWEPKFLEAMLRAMESHPSVTMAWCNQKVWEELPDGSWRDTGELANPDEKTGSRLVEFGDARQIMGALHANGAMILRSRPGETYATPSGWPFAGMEAFRDRMIPHPILYVNQPLAIFSRTLQTNRSQSHSEWALVQTMLASTFLKCSHYSHTRLAQLFADARVKQPPVTNVLLLAGLVEPACRNLLWQAKTRDWLLLLRGLARRPNVLWRVIRSRWRHQDWWRLLDQYTAARFEEVQTRR
jgi:glycosyltransferase involved in cell wall biosynthesis